MTDKNYLTTLRTPTEEDPLRVLVSACLMGTLCGADGTSYGDYPQIRGIAKLPNVHITSFCPEHFAFGTPRQIPDIENGNGIDVINGNARVVDETGNDITKGMLDGAHKMLEIAKANAIELAILMDVSAACGSQVIYKGHRRSSSPSYQIGKGVCAALLAENGFKIVSQRDFKSLDILLSKVNANHVPDKTAIDHDETTWYKEYFEKQ